MDEQKHYILVDNEAYELYDGNGSFYVTKAVNPTESLTNQTSEYTTENVKQFLDNFIIPAPPPPLIPDANTSCQVGQHLEPIIINDYGTMNYFTQAASNVTIYLNSNNKNNFMENIAGKDNYVVDQEGVIDLTKFSTGSKRNSSFRSPEKDASPDVEKSIQNVSNEEMDAPEFIDISKLKLSSPDTSILNRPAKKPRQTSCKLLTVNLLSEGSDDDEDDEVVFVKEFKADYNESNKKPLDLRRRPGNEREKRLPEPRRNPKRQVQLLKESFELALKLSDEEIYYGSNKKAYKECYTENPRKTSRNTGAILNPPDTLTNEDYREWPTEGLHERPVFNMATKKIEKFDLKPADDKRKAPAKKNDSKSTKAVTGKKPGKKGKRKVTNKSKKAKKESVEKGINKEFAALTHETLQEVIKYVSQVKQYNEIRLGKVCDTKAHSESGSLIDDAQSLINVVCSDSMEENLNNAVDLLTDSCILYSLANDVCQKSVAKYLDSITAAQKS